MKNCNRWEEGGEQRDWTYRYERVGRMTSGQNSEEGVEAKEVKGEETRRQRAGTNVFAVFPVAVGRFHLCAKILII